jgi:hypothetical protein
LPRKVINAKIRSVYSQALGLHGEVNGLDKRVSRRLLAGTGAGFGNSAFPSSANTNIIGGLSIFSHMTDTRS